MCGRCQLIVRRLVDAGHLHVQSHRQLESAITVAIQPDIGRLGIDAQNKSLEDVAEPLSVAAAASRK